MKRITFIAGHYGSGKSEFSLNLAIQKKVSMLVDLDIVNPYFRSRELETLLNENHVRMISSTLKKALGSDLPFISSQAFVPFTNPQITAILDLGGDGVGAKLMHQFSDFLTKEETDLLLCINVFREETENELKIMKMINQIEGSCGYKVTGLINNSNFLRETVFEDVLKGQMIIQEVSKKTNLPIIYTGIYDQVIHQPSLLLGEIILLKLYLRKNWL
ncbi:MAG: ATP-binding protein [Bacilli bacterium]